MSKRGRDADSAPVKKEKDRSPFNKAKFVEQTGFGPDAVILGIDEAGRGPVLGPMVYCGGFCTLGSHEELCSKGVADSKQLSEKARDSIFPTLFEVPSFQAIVKELTAQHISECMNGTTGKNLNSVSHNTAIEIISEATVLSNGKLAAVFVDTVGPQATYEAKLKARFPHLHVCVSEKADSRFPIVSAASIVAKVTRDRRIVEASVEDNASVGSGYPGDRNTVEYLTFNTHKVFGFPHFIRFSWGTAQKMLAAKGAAEVTFQRDLDGFAALDSGDEDGLDESDDEALRKKRSATKRKKGKEAPEPHLRNMAVPPRHFLIAQKFGLHSAVDIMTDS